MRELSSPEFSQFIDLALVHPLDTLRADAVDLATYEKRQTGVFTLYLAALTAALTEPPTEWSLGVLKKLLPPSVRGSSSGAQQRLLKLLQQTLCRIRVSLHAFYKKGGSQGPAVTASTFLEWLHNFTLDCLYPGKGHSI